MPARPRCDNTVIRSSTVENLYASRGETRHTRSGTRVRTHRFDTAGVVVVVVLGPFGRILGRSHAIHGNEGLSTLQPKRQPPRRHQTRTRLPQVRAHCSRYTYSRGALYVRGYTIVPAGPRHTARSSWRGIVCISNLSSL